MAFKSEPGGIGSHRLLISVVVVLFIAFGVSVILYATKSSKIDNQNLESNRQMAISNCIAYNVRSQSLREALKQSLVALVRPGTVLTDDQKAQIAAYDAAVDVQLPFRDCSPEAIQYYIDHPPADPAIEEQSPT